MFETTLRKRNTYFFLKTKDMFKSFFFIYIYCRIFNAEFNKLIK